MKKAKDKTLGRKNEKAEGFDIWAVVEIFGHQTYVGRVTEQAIGGCNFVRVDVPELPATSSCPESPGFTKLFGQNAIYSITPVEANLARQMALRMRVRPVTVYIPSLAAERQIEGSYEEG